MVKSTQYLLAAKGKRNITIEPVYEESNSGRLLSTGRYILSENNTGLGEIRFAGEAYGWQWDGLKDRTYNSISEIIKFIQDHHQPELE